jgi:hypothetical protein
MDDDGLAPAEQRSHPVAQFADLQRLGEHAVGACLAAGADELIRAAFNRQQDLHAGDTLPDLRQLFLFSP